jgi:hypothetical protein
MPEQTFVSCAHCVEPEYQSIHGIPLCREHYIEALEHGADLRLDLRYLWALHNNPVVFLESGKNWSKKRKRRVRELYAAMESANNLVM